MPPAQQPPKPKAERLELRLDPDLASAAAEKARQHGWSIAAVVRALLAKWVEEDLITGADVGASQVRAPREPRATPRKKSARKPRQS